MTEIGLAEVLKIIVIGIIEGITEWLPVSSTGHMLLFDEFIPLVATESFKNTFFVVIQLGAILAVVTVFFKKMMPVEVRSIAPANAQTKKKLAFKQDSLMLWAKVIVAVLPSAVAGLFLDDIFEETFGSPMSISVMLIVYGIAFIVVEKLSVHRTPKCDSIDSVTFLTAFIIGCFQVLSLIPGTSRSGATIIGALIIGVSRSAAAEFTFFLAVPTMLGASLLKILKLGALLTGAEITALLIGMAVAYAVSLVTVKFLMGFVKKHSFTVFGCYRIVLGAIVILVTLLR